jgi:LacI family transcriptional regulator
MANRPLHSDAQDARQAQPTAASTLRQVAKLSGVSVATASRVINNSKAVDPDTRARVEAAVDKLHYVPNGAARALSKDSAATIGAIVPTLENPNFAIGVNALQLRCQQEGYTLLLSSSNYNAEAELEQARILISRGIDGLMLVGTHHAPELIDLLRLKGVPYVNTWVFNHGDPTPCVGFDNHEAAYRLTKYLLDLGHRDFGVIAGMTRNNDRAVARVDGIHQALLDANVSLPRECLIERPYRVADGREAMRALLTSEHRPSAVICGNDLLAFGASIAASELGMEVPTDVSVAGFDDLDFSAHLRPALTTMRVPAQEIGTRAADFLLARIAGRPVPPQVRVEIELVVRGSTAPPTQRQGRTAK